MLSVLSRARGLHSAQTGERGAAAVELAIVLFPLLLLLLGIVEFGRLYSQQLTMQHAAREAARTIALAYDDPGMTSTALMTEAQGIITDLVSFADASDLDPFIQLCDPAVTTEQTAVVALEDDLELSIPLPDPAWRNVPVRAKAEMPCEG